MTKDAEPMKTGNPAPGVVGLTHTAETGRGPTLPPALEGSDRR
jgi:hypothetical protein